MTTFIKAKSQKILHTFNYLILAGYYNYIIVGCDRIAHLFGGCGGH